MTPDPEQTRYHVYRVVAGEPIEVASTSRDGIGLALVTLRDEGQLTDDDRVGILDRRDDDEHGRWVVNPFGVGA
jgi:hypothetical protein